jgi:diaminopimelate epimerase
VSGIEVYKWYAEGNAYLVVKSTRDAEALLPWAVDSRAGLGGDGVLVVDWSDDRSAGMHILNRDGSEAPACGNGARCVAALAILTGRADAEVVVRSPGATITHRLTDRARLAFRQVMTTRADPVLCRTDDDGCAGWQLELGTQHRVVFDEVDDPAIAGPAQCAAWPGGTNVMFARVVGAGVLDVRPWERGVGVTRGCATGAAAAAIAAARQQPDWPEWTLVRQPGGQVEVAWGDGELVTLGRAQLVATAAVTPR